MIEGIAVANQGDDPKAVIHAIAGTVALFLEQVLAEYMERVLDWVQSRCRRGRKPSRS